MSLTKRSVLLKLELAGDVHRQLEKVAGTLYNINEVPSKKTQDSNQWYTTDEILYSEAKKAYDDVMRAFEEPPRVYKLESIKEKIWENNKLILDPKARKKRRQESQKPMASTGSSTSASPRKRAKKLGAKVQEEEEAFDGHKLTLDEQVGTYIDPFQVPKPWRVDMKNGKPSYYNEETWERFDKKPDEIWHQKLNILEKLTPREDLDGFEYKEDEAEKRKRNRTKLEYEKQMLLEIERRDKQPTDLEIIEDTLFDLISSIAVKEELEARSKKNKEKRKIRATWSVITKGYPMRALKGEPNDDGKVIVPVSDMDFLDVVISPIGLVIPTRISKKATLIHQFEKEDKEKILKLQLEKEIRERQKPLVEKAKGFVRTARYDLSYARDEFIGELKKDAKYHVNRIKNISGRQLLDSTKHAVIQGVQSLINYSKSPMSTISSMKQSLKNALSKNSAPKELNIQALLDEEEKNGKEVAEVVVEVESEASKRLKLLKEAEGKYESITHEDRVMIRMILAVDLPPAYIMRPPPTWEDDVKAAKDRLRQVTMSIRDKILDPNNPVYVILENMNKMIHNKSTLPPIEMKQDGSVLPPLPSNLPSELPRANTLPKIENAPNALLTPEILSILISVPGGSHLIQLFGLDKMGKKPEEEKLFYDDSARIEFENKFLADIAKATCIPKRNISLEEVRRLSNKDPRLKEMFERREKLLIQFHSDEIYQQRKENLSHILRKAREEGNFDDVVQQPETQLLLQQLGAVISPLGEVIFPIIAEDPNEDHHHTGAIELAVPLENGLLVKETNAIGNETKDVDERKDANSTIVNENSAASEGEGMTNAVVPANPQPLLLPPPPQRPPPFRIGVLNPTDLLKDSHYWLSKDMKHLSSEERRQQRIHRLMVLAMKETGIKAKIKLLKEKRDELVDDVLDYLEPVKEMLIPYSKQARELLTQGVTVCRTKFEVFKQLTNERLNGKRPSSIPVNENTSKSSEHNNNGGSPELKNNDLVELDKMPSESIENISDRDEIAVLLEDMCLAVERDLETQSNNSIQPNNNFTQPSETNSLPEDFDTLENALQEELRTVHAEINELEKENTVDMENEQMQTQPSPSEETTLVVDAIDNNVEAEVSNDMDLRAQEDGSEENLSVLLEREKERQFDQLRHHYFQTSQVSVVNCVFTMMIAVDLFHQNGETDDSIQEVYADLADYYKDEEDELALHPPVVKSDHISLDPEQAEETEEEKQWMQRMKEEQTNYCGKFACEITFMIFVGEEQRKLEGLEDIEAEDIAVMLEQQAFEAHSVLRQGTITQHILDIRYELGCKKMFFDSWQSYWVHIIHPCFFGYSSCPSKASKNVDDSEKLPNGIQVVNPISLIPERAKQAYQALENKNKVLKPIKAKRHPRVDQNESSRKKLRDEEDEEDQNQNKSSVKKPAKVSLLDVNNGIEGDEVQAMDLEDDGKGGKKLKVFRPNMQKLTMQDIKRLKRVYKAFQEYYEETMTKGLVDGKNLRVEQFQAMKDRDTAFRIYRVARHKYHRDHEHENVNPFAVPPLQVTRISEAQFEGWVEEVRQEESQALKEKREKTHVAKIQRQHELEVKKKQNQIRSWCLGVVIQKSQYPVEVGYTIQMELDKELDMKNRYKLKTLSQDETKELLDKEHQFQMTLISEEKNMKRVFDYMLDWKKRFQGMEAKALLIPSHDSAVVLDTIGNQDVLEYLDIFQATINKEDLEAEYLIQQHAFDQVEIERVRRIESLSKTAPNLRIKFNKEQATQEASRSSYYDKCKGLLEDALSKYNLAKARFEAIDIKKRLDASEVALCRTVKCVTVLLNVPEFRHCFSQWPTAVPQVFARDEMTQVALIFAELEPLFSNVISKIKKRKEDELIAAGIKASKRLKAKEESNVIQEASSQPTEESLLEQESLNRNIRHKETEERRKRRENAWLRAHPHIYISIPGDPEIFCLECKEREHEAWLQEFMEKEDKWKAHFEDLVLQYFEDNDEKIREQVENDYDALHDAKKKEDRRKYEENMLEKQQKKSKFRLNNSKLSSNTGSNKSMKVMGSANAQKMSLLLASSPSTASSSNEAKVSFPTVIPNEEMMRMASSYKMFMIESRRVLLEGEIDEIQRKLFIPPHILRSGLSYIDCKGNLIVPMVTDKVIDPNSIPLEVDVMESEGEDTDSKSAEAKYGLKIRVWHFQDRKRRKFLGQIKISHEDMMNPPKGIRSFILEEDPRCMRSNDNITIQGSIAVKFNAVKVDRSTGVPLLWRLEIDRLNGIANAVDVLSKSNPICEVLWKGPLKRIETKKKVVDQSGKKVIEKKEICVQQKRWIPLGFTKHHEKVCDVVFQKEDDVVFELPPIWTDGNVPLITSHGEITKVGGWISKNRKILSTSVEVIEKDTVEESKVPTDSLKRENSGKKLFKKAVKGIMISSLLSQQAERTSAVEDESKLRMDTYRLLKEHEELERQCMAHEEILQKRVLIWEECQRADPYVQRQKVFQKEFGKLVEFIQEAPPLLSRLRFMMGEETGGSYKLLCEDPTSRARVNLNLIPILYPEDEEVLLKQLSLLSGRQHNNVIRIVDYSVHQIRRFNAVGFASIDERVAIIILGKYNGWQMSQYLDLFWDSISNEHMRDIFLQIVAGLGVLHDEGILHRNISDEAFLLEYPVSYAKKRSHSRPNSRPSSSSSLVDVPNVRVGDFWFLHNPRRPGCPYSQGRSDWGYSLSTPPEARGGFLLTDKSDIYAFGVMVYQWLTRGLQLPDPMDQSKIEPILRDISLKWGVWVPSLLRMCLQENPKNRPSAKDLELFLRNRIGKNAAR